MFECTEDSSVYYIFIEYALLVQLSPRTMVVERHSGKLRPTSSLPFLLMGSLSKWTTVLILALFGCMSNAASHLASSQELSAVYILIIHYNFTCKKSEV